MPPVSRQLGVAAGRARTASGSRRLLGCAAFRAARTRACHCLRMASAAGAQHQNISRERDTDSEVDLGDDKVGGIQIQTVQIKDSKYYSLRLPSTVAELGPDLGLVWCNLYSVCLPITLSFRFGWQTETEPITIVYFFYFFSPTNRAFFSTNRDFSPRTEIFSPRTEIFFPHEVP